jgi:mannose-1-phosphate guanylyltransferase
MFSPSASNLIIRLQEWCIEPGNELHAGGGVVVRFIERPNAGMAERWIHQGFLRNFGNVMFQAGILTEQTTKAAVLATSFH